MSITPRHDQSAGAPAHSKTWRISLSAFFFLILALLAPSAHARINVVNLPGRDSVQLTIYNSVDLTLVKETRFLTFRKGLIRLGSWLRSACLSTLGAL